MLSINIVHTRYKYDFYKLVKQGMRIGLSERGAIEFANKQYNGRYNRTCGGRDYSPKGGSTSVFIYDVDSGGYVKKTLGYGNAKCSFIDNYDKSTGRAIALYRALQSIFKDYGTSYDEELKQKLDTENLDEYLYFLQMKISFMGVK